MKLCPRRPGDATAVYASTEKARRELGWKYVQSLFCYAVQFDTIHQINLLMYVLYSFFMFCKFDVSFRAKYGVEEMCRDQWKWAVNNPWGYGCQSKP